MRVDLHIHTTASDGKWTADELIDQLNANDIKIFSITDHDRIESSEYVKRLDLKGKTFVPGVEISCTYSDKEYHLTTYKYDSKNKGLLDLLSRNLASRNDYDQKVIRQLSESYNVVDYDEYFLYEYDHSRGGWKGLNYLIDKGVCKDIITFFQLVKDFKFTMTFEDPKEVISIIKKAGGKPFLAHPSAYHRKRMSEEELLIWKSFGVVGVECHTPYNKEGDANFYKEFCKKNDLMISGGSDCHGGFVGRTIGLPDISLIDLNIDSLL